jgi:hypothetical protein
MENALNFLGDRGASSRRSQKHDIQGIIDLLKLAAEGTEAEH